MEVPFVRVTGSSYAWSYADDVGSKISGFRDEFGSIHASFHTLVDSPSPMAFPKWLMRRSLPLRIPFQPWEAEGAAATVRKEQEVQYFPIKIRARRQSGFVISLHANFPRSA